MAAVPANLAARARCPPLFILIRSRPAELALCLRLVQRRHATRRARRRRRGAAGARRPRRTHGAALGALEASAVTVCTCRARELLRAHRARQAVVSSVAFSRARVVREPGGVAVPSRRAQSLLLCAARAVVQIARRLLAVASAATEQPLLRSGGAVAAGLASLARAEPQHVGEASRGCVATVGPNTVSSTAVPR